MADVPTRTNPDGSLTEVALSHCRNGHELGPGRVSLYWLMCGCAGGRGHRVYRCAECKVEDHLPRHDEALRFTA